MTKQQKYILLCPKCKTIHNVSEQMNIWKDELFKELNKAFEKVIKNVNNS